MKRKGSGGTFRAWTRLTCSGAVGKPDLKKVAEAYHVAKSGGDGASTYEIANALGLLATQKGKATRNKKGAFGMSITQVRRTAFLAAVEKMWVTIATKPIYEQVAAILEFSAVRTFQRDAVSVAKLLQRMQNAKKRLQADRVCEQLQSWKDKHEESLCNEATMRLPALSGKSMEPVLAGPLRVFHVKNTEAIDKAIASTAWLGAHKESSLGVQLSRYWNELHELKANPPKIKSSAPKSSPCLVAGVCVCNAEGTQLRMRLARFKKLLKAEFMNSEAKPLLYGGSVVAQFVPSAGVAEHGADRQSSSTSSIANSIFLHIALMYASPMRPTFMLLLATPPPNATSGVDDAAQSLCYVEVSRRAPTTHDIQIRNT
eukprot:4088861-Amphidinium_carterae.2